MAKIVRGIVNKLCEIPKMEHFRLMALIDKVQEFLLWALIFCLPFSKSLMEILFTCMFVLWITKRILVYRREKKVSIIAMFKPVSTKLNFPILIFFIVNFASTVRSVSIFLSLEGLFLKLFEYIAMYFITVEVMSDTKKRDKVLIAVLLSVFLITVNGIFQYVTGTDFIRHFSFSGRGWIQSSFGNQNDFAAWLILMLPPVLALAYFWMDSWRDHFGKFAHVVRSMRSVLWALTVFLIICLIFAGSRGAWISAIFSLIFLGIIMKNIRLLFLIPVVVLICSLIVPNFVKERAKVFVKSFSFSTSSAVSPTVSSSVSPTVSPPASASVSSDIAPASFVPSVSFSTNVEESVSVRLKLWKEAIAIVEDFPITGTGPNTYSIVAPSYKKQASTGFYPHNSYLHMAAEIGLLGLGTFLLTIATLFIVVFIKIVKTKDKFQRALLAGFLSGLFGFLGHSVVDTNLFAMQLSMLMWMVMGIIVAIEKNE
ncbi:MAG: O-antigen ligase family protein [Candidatus Omnitrophica bacterium]|nr:O-antigen ligase family protein [Candidatus Omnitrophota bacterium]